MADAQLLISLSKSPLRALVGSSYAEPQLLFGLAQQPVASVQSFVGSAAGAVTGAHSIRFCSYKAHRRTFLFTFHADYVKEQAQFAISLWSGYRAFHLACKLPLARFRQSQSALWLLQYASKAAQQGWRQKEASRWAGASPAQPVSCVFGHAEWQSRSVKDSKQASVLLWCLLPRKPAV